MIMLFQRNTNIVTVYAQPLRYNSQIFTGIIYFYEGHISLCNTSETPKPKNGALTFEVTVVYYLKYLKVLTVASHSNHSSFML